MQNAVVLGPCLGNVGGKGHFAWSVVGDIPNTASRIQGLSKHLGTRMLASCTVVGDFDELLTRRVGGLKTSHMTGRHGFTWNLAGSTRPQLWRSMTPQ